MQDDTYFNFGFDFETIKSDCSNADYNKRYESLIKRKGSNNIFGIKQHNSFKTLSRKRLRQLLETARDKLKVGFEIEFNDVSYSSVASKLKDAGIITDAKNPIKTIYKAKEFYSSGYGDNQKISVEVPENIDMFKEHELIAYAYNDGSVPLEVVTTAYNLNLFELESNLRKIHNLIHKHGKKASCNCLKNCGLHQTFCFEHKKDKFNRIVIANIFQICRAFSSGIFYLFSFGNQKTRTRDISYRRLNNSVWIRNTINTDKYSFVNNKHNELIEFRWVDGCNSPFLASLCALFNYAVIKKAIKLSQYGVLAIDSNFFRKNKEVTENFAETKEIDTKFIRFNALKLLSFLRNELVEAGIYEYLVCLLENPIWQREFNKDSLRSWKEQENRIKAVRQNNRALENKDLLVLLNAGNCSYEKGCN